MHFLFLEMVCIHCKMTILVVTVIGCNTSFFRISLFCCWVMFLKWGQEIR